MSFQPVSSGIITLLEEESCWHETFEHEPVRTSEEASKVRPGYTLSQGAKAIILRVRDKPDADRFVMLVFPADQRFDSKKARAALGVTGVRFASAEEVESVTEGVEVGAVPPFGGLFGLEVIADPRSLRPSESYSMPAIGGSRSP
jgi:Ala-tRNA(Pro) deacylase